MDNEYSKYYRHSEMFRSIGKSIPSCNRLLYSAHSNFRCSVTHQCSSIPALLQMHSFVTESSLPTQHEPASLTEYFELISDYYGCQAGSVPRYSALAETCSCMKVIIDKCGVGRPDICCPVCIYRAMRGNRRQDHIRMC